MRHQVVNLGEPENFEKPLELEADSYELNA